MAVAGRLLPAFLIRPACRRATFPRGKVCGSAAGVTMRGRDYMGRPKGPGRPRTYRTAAALEKAIDGYFSSISRTVVLKDLTGDPVLNDEGQQIRTREYLIPPSVQGLSLHLGIDRRTWLNYCDPEQHPEFSAVTARTQLRLEEYLVRESLTREKGLHGVTFNLEHNYGWARRTEVELGEKTRRTAQVQSLTMQEKMALIRQAAKELAAAEADGEQSDMPDGEL